MRFGELPAHLLAPGWVLALSPLHTRRAQAWPSPPLGFTRSALGPHPPPALACSPLTAEPLWPASPRSPGMPMSPYAGREGVSRAGAQGVWRGG